MMVDVTKAKLFSIPNMLSIARLALVPVLVTLAYLRLPQAFLAILAISLLSDVFDGYLARKLNQTSELGAKLDSWGDVLTYASMMLGLYWVWPDVFVKQAWFLLAATLAFVVPVAHALSKFGEYPSYHTLSAKTAAVLMAPAFYVLTLMGADLFFQAVIVFHILVACEEIAITAILAQPRSNVRSVFGLIYASKISEKSR